jgi:soluble lytic murein transglycosylase
VDSGDHALFIGDWESAIREFSAAAASSNPEIKAAAALGLGRAYYYSRDYAKALSFLREVVENYQHYDQVPAAYFFLGETYVALARHSDAAEAYFNYAALRPGLIDAYVFEKRGDALLASGNYAAALADFQAALQSPRTGDRIPLQIKTARSHALTGDYATALVMYQDIYNRGSDLTRAQVNLLMGRIYMNLEQPEQAYSVYKDSVANYQQAYDSYQALVELVNAGIPVSELDRGVVDYYAKQYNVAVAAFDRYLSANPTNPSNAHYFKGLSLRALGSHAGALEQFDIVINDYSGSTYWANAWEQKANTLLNQMNDREGCIQTILDFVEAASWHSKAPELLFKAGRDAEIGGELDLAAQLWERTGVEYPNDQNSFRALFMAGITRYRLKEYDSAQDLFQRSLGLAGSASFRSAAYLWMGKTFSAQGDQSAARTSWEYAANTDPTGYYSERARDLLAGRMPFTAPPVVDLAYDPQREQAAAEEWMRSTFGIPSVVDLSGAGPLMADPRLLRGTELWRLGFYRQGRDELEDLRTTLDNDPAGSYRLANYTLDLGVYRTAILSARRVLTLAEMDDATTMNAPMFFNRIRFGTYYGDLVLPAAEKYEFHPFLIFSVIRQESFFEPFVGSSAGARGLMQFMPATGQERADRLSWPPGYIADDLDRALVSVTFGASYLDFTRKYLDGDLYGALAAYNGGPGNARVWKDLASDDPDLFLEVVRFEETRRYIRAIYEMFSIYARLYSRAP